MTRRIFRSVFLAALGVLLLSMSLFLAVIYPGISRDLISQLHIEGEFAVTGVSQQGLAYLESMEPGLPCRITWISKEGTVLFDNRQDTASMVNHLQREEIREAFETGYGESSRYSDTLLESTIYAAWLLPDGTVLRLSHIQSTVWDWMWQLGQPILLVLSVAVLLSLYLAHRLSKKIVEPLNTLELDAPLANRGYEEISPLLHRISSQQEQLAEQSRQLKQRQREFDTVIKNMSEGLVLLGRENRILSCNPAAVSLLALDAGCVGQDLLALCPLNPVKELVTAAFSGTASEGMLSVPEGEYQVDANPVRAGGQVFGVVLLLIDVTQKKLAEQQRREFTANVSHELKTPLHTISGYAELMKNGLAKQEDMADFSGKIYLEAQRMVRLVEDILRLSRLDEGKDTAPWEICDLYAIAEQVLKNMEPAARDAGIQLRLLGSSLRFWGIPELVEVMISNLCSNAIKYNRPAGTVTVYITDEGKFARLLVSDTGIGISKEHQNRIFERFYRVDKSRSKQVGGTGLGLSIVKHAALVLGAQLHLQSTPGKGTDVTVLFPKHPEPDTSSKA